MASDDQARFEDAEVMRETDKALLINIEGEEKWVPKSVIDDDSEVFDGRENRKGALVLKLWWAEQEGLV